MGRFSSHYPDINVKESQKDEQWHKDFIKGIINDAIDGRYEFSYRAMQESYDYYDGTQAVEEYNFLQESESGDTLPAIWINYNKVRTKVDTLIGEFSDHSYGIRVRAQNKDAVSERLQAKLRMLGKMNIKDDLIELEGISGVPTAPTENLPESQDELEYHMTNTYKDKSEKVMEAALKYLIKKYQWQALRLELFRDLVITGRSFVKTEIEDGLPKWRRVDPRYMVFDIHSKDDFLRDCTYFGEVRYVPLADAKQIYNLTDKEIKEIEKAGASETDNFLNAFNSHSTQVQSETNLDFITGSGTSLKVLVFHAEWQDFKNMKRKKSVDKFGNTHYKKVKENAKGNDIVKRKIKTWRKGTLIGGKVMRDFGLRENMIRSVDDIYDTTSSYVPLCHNWLNYRTVSKVDLMKGLQKFKNITLYNLQLAMNRAGTKGFMYDISKIPEGWNLEEVLYYIKTAGIGVYNSQKDGISNPGKSFEEFDMTMSNSINQYITFSKMIDDEMNEISGISSERQGKVTAASQAVGVTQSAIASSVASTKPMHDAFRRFSENVMNNMAGLVKIVYGEDRETFAPIIGDAGVDFIKQDVDLHLQDYGVFVEVTPPLLADRAKFEQLLTAALQAGKVEIEDALDLIRESGGDIDLSIGRLKRSIEKKKKEDAERQHKMALEMEQAKAQSQQAAQQSQFQMKQADEQMKNQRQTQQGQESHRHKMSQIMLSENLKAQNNI